MPTLPIVKFGNPVLTEKAEKVKSITEEIIELSQNMIRTMHLTPGLGLAAPQVNVAKQLITIDISIGENSKDLIVLINPEILSQEGIVSNEEGCLSIPGIHDIVQRPTKVVVRGTDLQGKEKVIEAEELLARVLSHEIDHINGKLFIDHLSPLKRNLIKKKLRKQLETETS